MKKYCFATVFFLWLSGALAPLSVSVRCFDHPDYTRVVLEGDHAFPFTYRSEAKSLEITLNQRLDFPEGVVPVRNSVLVDRVVYRNQADQSVLRVEFKSAFTLKKSFVLESPFRLVFDLVPIAEATPLLQQKATEADAPQQPPPPTVTPAQTDTSPEAVKRKAIETICLDPGHGGEDLGAVSKGKLLEKEVTLAVAKKLRKQIESKLGLRVIMTRDSDMDVSLNSRASIANNQQAQMFVSIHVNSSFRKSAFGSETYYVSLNATDNEALELARKENQEAVPAESQTPADEELKMILWNMAQTEYIKESSKLAEFIQNELNDLLNTRNRGVKQAPFRVLMRTAMPAVLVEIAFISNGTEEKKLKDEGFLSNVAEAVYSGIAKFIAYCRSFVQ